MSDDEDDKEGTLLPFRRPEKPAEERELVHVYPRRRWKWTDAEIEIGFSVRHDGDGEAIIIAVQNPGNQFHEIWLPVDSVEREYGLHPSSLLSRLYPVLRAAKARASLLRRENGKREVVAEAIGVDGAWKLVRGTLPRGSGMADEVWWEVTGGGHPVRIYEWGGSERVEKEARRDFDQHKPPYRCGAFRSGSDCKHGWSHDVDGEPCIRKANHPEEHRNRDSESWSSWPRRARPYQRLFGT